MTGTGGSGTITGCVDKRGDCASYAIQTCTNPKYTEWVKDNCARTCLCSGGSYYTERYVGPSGSGTGTIAGSNVQVTITAITTPVSKKTTTSSKTTPSTMGISASTIRKATSTVGTTASTIGTTTSTVGTTASTIGTTISTMGTTTSTINGITAKKQPCLDDPRLACDISVCNTDLKIFCQLTCNRCP
ncbi:uncharacterized protein LOC143053785 isoform X2 [Mytilus galloprovincialis]|uniref:uncharacterized protein LOC143053785 isoform X2 n=1 Tax=Mytilus galloprovincialis TaxID=29158 RepID=UPI003F7CA541